MARAAEVVAEIDDLHQTEVTPCECTKCLGRYRKRTMRCPGCNALNTLLPIKKIAKDFVYSNDHVSPIALLTEAKQRTASIMRGRPEPMMLPEERMPPERSDDDDDDGPFDDDNTDLPEVHTVGDSKFVDHERIATSIDSLDKQLSPRKLWKKGAGVALGRLYGITGLPGSGKSTIFLQALMSLSAAGAMAVLIDGEEVFEDSMSMINSIAPNMGIKKKDLLNLKVIDDCRIIEDAFDRCEELDADAVLINSLQEFKCRELEDVDGGPFAAGNPAQKKAVIRSVLEFAKGKAGWSRPRAVFLVIQVKGDGEIDGEGNKVLHKVDALMQAERDPEYDVPGSEGELRVFLKFVDKKSRGLDPSVVSVWQRVREDGSMADLGLLDTASNKKRAPRRKKQ